MATKNNPGAFDCYAKAEPDEPMFVLLGRDRHAASLVSLWALLREMEGEDIAVVEEAEACARDMSRFAESRGKTPILRRDVARIVGLVGPGTDRGETLTFLRSLVSALDARGSR